MEIIKSKNNKKIKYAKSLFLKKNRIKNAQFLIEGKHLCQMAKETGLLGEVLLTPETNFNFENKVFVNSSIIKMLSDAKTPQSIIGIAKIKDSTYSDSNYLLLDEVQDPSNLGAILRCSLAFGFENVVLSQNTVDIYNPKVLRSAQGANFKLNIIKANLLEELPKLKAYKVATTLKEHSTKLSKFNNFSNNLAVIVGNEGNGIRKEILQLADEMVHIEIKNIDSLNVAVATGIVLNHIRNKGR